MTIRHLQINTPTGGGIPGGADAIPSDTREVLITVEGQTVRMREDGTAPTAAEGWPIIVGAIITCSVARALTMKFYAASNGGIVNFWFRT